MNDASVWRGMGLEDGTDQVLDALGHKYRRRLLFALAKDNPQSASNPQNAQDILSPNFGRSSDGLSPQISMHHSHLPKLEEYGYIEWDTEAEIIEKGQKWDDIAPLVQLLRAHDDDLDVEGV